VGIQKILLCAFLDHELERLVKERGPLSIEARIVEILRKRRAKDHQVHAFRVGTTTSPALSRTHALKWRSSIWPKGMMTQKKNYNSRCDPWLISIQPRAIEIEPWVLRLYSPLGFD
jgi:hypothetical protein